MWHRKPLNPRRPCCKSRRPNQVFASKRGEFAKETNMDLSVAEQVLDEFIPSLEALEAQSGAILQFLKEKGIATDEQLAPYLEQARSASNVRWLAVRLRMNRLLTPAFETGEETKKTTEDTKEAAVEPAQKRAEEASELPEGHSSRKEVEEDTSKFPKNSTAETKRDVVEAKAEEEPKEKKGSRNDTIRERTEEDAA
jgi:hypothetical protein